MYLSPEAETVEVKIEGVICESVTATMNDEWEELTL